MAEETNTTYVARAADLAALQEHWAAARNGEPRMVRVEAPLGGGKRALTSELARTALAEDEDVLLWRVILSDEQDGLQNLIRLYAGLFQALHRSPGMRGRVEMALNAQLPHEPTRTQNWFQAFIEGLKKGAPKPGETEFQVILPRDNPLVGLIEVTSAIARKFPILLDLHGIQNVHSVGLFAFFEALLDEVILQEDEKYKLLVLMGLEPIDESAKMAWSLPLLDFLERRDDDLDKLEMAPWGAEEVSLYLESRGKSGDAANLARIASGRPGFVAELVDWLDSEGKLGDDLSGISLGDITVIAPDEDELDGDDDDDEEDDGDEQTDDGTPARRKAEASDAESVAFTAALLGLTFPSGLVADLRGLERDSVDDLLDATSNVYKELQFSKAIGTWLYQFNKALLRESVLARHTSEDDQQHRVLVARAMERSLVPRGYPYILKTAQLYADGGDAQRAALMRSLALAQDQPQMWAMAHDLLRYFDESPWPSVMRRTVYLQLLDRMLKTGGQVEQSEALLNEALKWANSNADRPMQGLLLFMGSQLDMRRQDLYRARDRANDALKVFSAMGDKLKQGEVYAHLATIELNDGNINAALDQARLAEEVAPVPPMQSQAEFVRGHAARRNRATLPQAVEHFRKANEIAGRAGLGPQALQSGLAFGETLLMSGENAKAADVLGQVQRIAAQLQNAPQERAACALLGQAQAAVQNYEAALGAANRALELTRALGFKQFEPFDLFNVAMFNLQLKRPTEAVALFRQAREKANTSDQRFMKELQFNMGMAMVQIGQRGEGAQSLRASIEPATQARDWGKVLVANRTLADIERAQGNLDAARRYLEGAVKAAEAGGMKEDRKQLRRQIDTLK